MKCKKRNCGRHSEFFRELQFHRFPLDPELRMKWIDFAGLKKNVEIVLSFRLCSAHFTNEDYVQDKNGKMVKRNNAVPTIPAELEVDTDDDDAGTMPSNVSLPLYSSPALQDHNYVDFIAGCTRIDEYSDDDDVPAVGIDYSPITAPLSALRTSPKDYSTSTKTNRPPIENKTRSSSGHTRCSKTIKHLKKKASFWKSKALMWKRKYDNKTGNTKSPEKKLMELFHKDQSDILLGKVNRVRKWSSQMIIEGLKIRFVSGSGYDTIRQTIRRTSTGKPEKK